MPSSAAGRVAILSFQSHRDRSFLDDRELALLSGSLTAAGHDNDLVVTVLDGGGGPRSAAAEEKLTSLLREYDIVLFERVWSADLVRRLREATAHAAFVWLRGEHELERPPADWRCSGDLHTVVPALLDHLRGRAEHPPAGAFVLRNDTFVPPARTARVAPRERRFAPNLAPRVVNPEALPPLRIFSLQGNEGCAYQVDARANPLYAGTDLPDGMGRGCAFCTTGNHHAGRPVAEVARAVAGEIRYVRRHAPGLTHLVLVDQNPFPYLPELLRVAAQEAIGGFTLLLETRADWFVRSRARFEEALGIARGSAITLAPFLVGIENFSQPELDRFNKGMSAEDNVAFLAALWDWAARYAPTMTLDHAAFGFILLTPWTSMADLRINLDGIRRTRLDRLRGSLLVSRARLYPDTALYYLARRDGLLADAFASAEEDNSRRYGYYPSHPWRFQHPEVAHFSTLAAELTRRLGGRDQVRLFEALLAAFEGAGPEWGRLASADVLRTAQGAALGDQGPRQNTLKSS